jgi:O-antigen/teichoic acid export membrane protein
LGLTRNSLITFASQVAANLLQFVLGVLTARFLGPEGKGLIFLLIIWLSICVEFGTIGLGDASVYLIGKDRNRLPAALGNLLFVTAIVSLILGTAGWLFLQYGHPDTYHQFPLWAWLIVALLIPLQLLQTFLMRVLSAILRIKEIGIVEVSRTLLQLVLFVLLVATMDQGVAGAFLAYAFSISFAAGFLFVLVLYAAGYPKPPAWPLLFIALRYGIKAYLSNVLWSLTVRLHALLVAKLALDGINAVGVYSVAANLADFVLFIPASISLSLFPMVSAASVADANRLTPAACRHTMLLTIVLALGVAIAGPFVIHRLYGDAFAPATLPLMLLLPGVVLLAQANILFGDLNGRGKPGATVVSSVASLITALALDLALIPAYGVVGAALAASCAYAVQFMVAGTLFVHYSGLSWRGLFAFRRSDFACYLGLMPSIRKMSDQPTG